MATRSQLLGLEGEGREESSFGGASSASELFHKSPWLVFCMGHLNHNLPQVVESCCCLSGWDPSHWVADACSFQDLISSGRSFRSHETHDSVSFPVFSFSSLIGLCLVHNSLLDTSSFKW